MAKMRLQREITGHRMTDHKTICKYGQNGYNFYQFSEWLGHLQGISEPNLKLHLLM
jgi:hypothetical protein